MPAATRILVSVALVATPGASQEAVELELLVDGVSRPVVVATAGDGSGRLFLVEQGGLVRIWNGTELESEPFLDLSEVVDGTGGEQGLLGLAFHPEFADNGTFFVNYTWDPPFASLDRTRIERYAVSADDPDLAEPGSATTILEIEQEFANHNGGNLQFGPDGFLYVGMGDGGGGGDPFNRAQDVQTLLGKMLRIDVDGEGDGDCGLEARYAIPDDNPDLGPGACREIWAYGLRHPWRWSFDRVTGDLFIGDVGQGAREEIDFQRAGSGGGENYEWDCREGPIGHPGVCRGPGRRTQPILSYTHAEGCSVIGGYRYRGHHGPLWGVYFFGDFCAGTVWTATETEDGWQREIFARPGQMTTFGEGEDGELYVALRDGRILRLATPPPLFEDGFESGDTSAWTEP